MEGEWELPREFRETSSLLIGMYISRAPKGEIVRISIEAIDVRAKSPSARRSIIKRAPSLIGFYLDDLGDANVELAGDQSLVLVRDYLESHPGRGERPRQEAYALRLFGPTPWPFGGRCRIRWPHRLSVETNEVKKRSSSTRSPTVKTIGEISTNSLVAPYRRAFAPCVILMTYASVR